VILLCCLFCLAFEGRPIAMPIYAMRVKVNGERLWLCMYVLVLTKAFCKANHWYDGTFETDYSANYIS
jgi:hypothetical protein